MHPLKYQQGVNMLNIYDIMNNRSSCRSFTDREVTDETLDKVLSAACNAPSSGGFQNYSIIKIRNAENKHKLAGLCRNQMFIEKAPVCLIFCIDYRRIKRINEIIPAPCDLTNNFMDFWMSVLDTAICAQTLCIAAEAENLKSVYIGNIINTIDKVSDLLKLPEYVCPSIMVVLGYPKNNLKLSNKYDSRVIVHDEEYKDMDIESLLMAYEKKYADWNMKITNNLIDKIYDTCYTLYGKESAEKFKESALTNNKISPYQFWFGYYYLNYKEFLDLNGYINFMKRQEFNWIG